jgi:hypothetical protein
VNALIRPIIIIVSLPAIVLTLGLFTLIVNALMLYITSRLYPAFQLRSWAAAIGAVIIVWLVNYVFDFKDSDPIVVSVEARREKNEKYDAWVGAFNQFELIYLWGTERDETVRRVIVEDNPLYMYPLTISSESSKKLFLELAKTTHELETKPRFYNTFFSNCTNELAKVANKVKPNSVPFNLALFLPGYSVEELYKLGFIPNDQPIEKIKQRYYVSDLIKEIYREASFSALLRNKLLTK